MRFLPGAPIWTRAYNDALELIERHLVAAAIVKSCARSRAPPICRAYFQELVHRLEDVAKR
jgi:hypothetical protein